VAGERVSTSDVRVVVTRKMPAPVEAVISEHYDALFNRTDVALTSDQLVQVLQQADVVITTVTDKWHPGIFDTTSIRTKLLANVGVGVNHIALEAARRAGIAVSNTPDVVTDDTADVPLSRYRTAIP
jgi:lactate dehydrogenase-like 2-hydroxyacid dehydrogenase